MSHMIRAVLDIPPVIAHLHRSPKFANDIRMMIINQQSGLIVLAWTD